MKKIILLLTIGTTILFSSSCKPVEEENTPSNPTPASKTELLTSKVWKVTAFTLDGQNFFSQLDDCEKDDLTTFKTNGSFIEDEGATKCNVSDPQIITSSTWKFIDNETKILVDGDTATIKTLSTTSLILEIIISNQVAVITYTAQ